MPISAYSSIKHGYSSILGTVSIGRLAQPHTQVRYVCTPNSTVPEDTEPSPPRTGLWRRRFHPLPRPRAVETGVDSFGRRITALGWRRREAPRKRKTSLTCVDRLVAATHNRHASFCRLPGSSTRGRNRR